MQKDSFILKLGENFKFEFWLEATRYQPKA